MEKVHDIEAGTGLSVLAIYQVPLYKVLIETWWQWHCNCPHLKKQTARCPVQATNDRLFARCPQPRLSLSSSPGLGYSSCRQVAQQPFISKQSGIWHEFNLKSRHGWDQYQCVDEEVAFVLMSETLSIFEKHAGARCALFSRDSQTGVQTRLRVMGIFKKTKASILSASQCLLHIDTSPQRPVNNVDHVLPASQATSKNQHTYCLKSQSNCKRGNAAMQSSERRPEMNEVQSSHHRPIPWPRGENTRQRMTQKNEQEKNTARKSIVASCCFIFCSIP